MEDEEVAQRKRFAKKRDRNKPAALLADKQSG
jgi:hypothetical protein